MRHDTYTTGALVILVVCGALLFLLALYQVLKRQVEEGLRLLMVLFCCCRVEEGLYK